MKLEMCPACINDYVGEFGDEPRDFIEGNTKWECCPIHKGRMNMSEIQLAASKLRETMKSEIDFWTKVVDLRK